MLASPRASGESPKMALDKACRAPRIHIERHAVAVTAAIWGIPDDVCSGIGRLATVSE